MLLMGWFRLGKGKEMYYVIIIIPGRDAGGGGGGVVGGQWLGGQKNTKLL